MNEAQKEIAPKRRYPVGNIKRTKSYGENDWSYINCGDFGWCEGGWRLHTSDAYDDQTASMIYAGLVATGNTPEVPE